MDWREYIDRDPNVLGGKPRIKGTRISVELIVERMGDGWSVEQLREAYPHLTEQQILACLSFAADWLADTAIIDIPRSAV